MFKKAISLLLSLMLVVTTLSVTIVSVSAADSVYVVAGVPELCVNTWDPSPETSADNIMEAQEDGTFVKVYNSVPVMNDYQFKIVGDGSNWYGIDGGNDNFTFNVKSVCDVTITFNPETLKTTVTGEGVEIPTELVIESMRTVGNGDGNWLNGVAWDPADDSNLMTEVAPKVYEITYTDLDEFDNYQVKFAANGSWAANWGGVYAGSGVESEAAFNSNDNITIEVPYELADVTLRLDLTNFDYASKSGAKFTVTVTDKTGGEETTVATEATEETTEATEETTVATEPETTEATTAATEAPKGLTVNATSNYFPAFSTFVKEGEEYVTVTYFLDSSKDMLNCQWELKYDPNVLQFDNAVNMNEAGDDLNLMPQVDDLVWNVIANEDGSQAGIIKANATKLKLYKFANKGYVPFVTATFKVVGSGETTVDLFLDILTISKLGSNFMTDPAEEEIVVDSGVINDTPTKPNRVTVPHAGLYDPAATNPVETEPVTEATTVATEPETTVATEPETTVPATEPETTVPATEPVGDAVYVVAGVSELCGTLWDPSSETSAENVMTDNGDGTFSKVYSAVAPMDSYQLKVVENIGEAQNWIGIGPEYNDNFTFNVVEECDVTVTYEPATKTITVTGTGVVIPTELVIESMRAVGNGDGNWLNGVAWDPADDSNLMTEVSDKVYEITYTDLDAFDNYQVKFAANGSWAANWGGVYAGSGVETPAGFNSNDNITVEVPYELADVTLRLDLTDFDFASKTGAKFTVTVTDKTPATEPETTVPATEPETTVPATEPETTAPATGLTVNATSNYFPAFSTFVKEGEEYVTVTYLLDSSKDMLNCQWELKYDPNVLQFDNAVNMNESGDDLNLMPQVDDLVWNVIANEDGSQAGRIKANATKLKLYKFADKGAVPFVTTTFKVVGSGETTVDLFLDILTLSKLGSNFMTDPAEEEVVVDSGVINDTPTKPNRVTVVHAGLYDPVYTEPVTEATTVPATEPETTVPATEPETTVPATEPVGDAVYVVAGVSELCGTLWDPSPETSAENVMTDNGDGTFSKVYSAVAPMDSYQLKVVENIGETANWIGIGPEYNDNFTFNVVEECDVTVTYEPATKTITVTGTGVVIPTELVIESMRAVGNGDGNWLNGVAWDPADDSNLMTEVSDKVYEITYTDLDAFDNYQVKFAANGSWAANWGGVYAGSGVESEAAFNSNDNITVEVPYELADVTLRLDLTNFDFASKTGAKFTVTVTDKTPATEPETTVPETTVPETTVPATEPETTAPATGLNIKATSNYFPEANYTLTEADGTDLVTVTYYFDCAKQLLNTQWTLTFDPAVLSALPENNVAGFMPFATNGAMYETPAEGVIKGSASNLGLYDIKDGQAFVQVTFKALTFTGDTVVDLFVEDLTVSERNAEGNSDETKEETLVANGVPAATETPVTLDTVITPGAAPVEDVIYVVAGVPDLCGTTWDPSPVTSADNVMTDNGDGTFSKVYNDVAPKNDLQIKVVENIGEAQTWVGIGPEYNDNFTFNVVEECDVTVTYEPATKTITVTGTGVVIPTELVIESMRTVGNGDGNWLNGVAWDPADDSNLMTEVSDKVYEITYTDLDAFDNYQVKFAANGSWAANWGGVYAGSGVESEAAFNSNDNITIEVPYELADVTLRLDLTDFDFASKTGAKFTVTVTDKTPATVPTTAPVTTAPATTAPVTTAPVTTVPATTAPATTVPATTVPATTAPATTVPATTVPATTAPATTVPATTVAPATNATGATGATVNPGTADTPAGGTTSNGSAVQTGNASMAVIILLVLVSACGVLYFTRKRVK